MRGGLLKTFSNRNQYMTLTAMFRYVIDAILYVHMERL